MHFLVAVDGSDASDAAVDHVADLAARLDAAVTVVHAVSPGVVVHDAARPPSYTEADDRIVTEGFDDAEERGLDCLDEAADRIRATAPDVEVRTELLYGDPIESIPAYAGRDDPDVDEAPFDGLVVGHRGLSDRYEALVGSVAKALVERSPVPVTVVN
jgi:nucleotide-binding universal stress UspA family protein